MPSIGFWKQGRLGSFPWSCHPGPSPPAISLEARGLGPKFGGVGRGGECGSTEGLGVSEPSWGLELSGGWGRSKLGLHRYPAFPKFSECPSAFAKDPHWYPCSLTERNPKRIFAFMNKDGEQKQGVVLVLQGAFARSARPPRSKTAPRPQLLPRNNPQHLSVQPPEL